MDGNGRRFAGLGRLAMGTAWAVLLLGLWMWGRDTTEGAGVPAPTTGDVAAVGRPPSHPLPPAHTPLAAARPKRVVIEAAGVRAPIVASGLDRDGAVKPPPYSRPGAVGWYRAGPEPGSPGTALLVGHVDTKSKPAVFHGLGDLKRGERVRVARSDGTTAEFTVEDVEVVPAKRFDARRVYGSRSHDRAELRLITCGGKFNRSTKTYSANVVVSAYLTGTTGSPRRVSAGSRNAH
ncbi:class F sortase [Streptomyces luomodiensis]|uniref:Class F sortase n=1 Tax=Streptomyces luomodiensis TaxID=3026192 RepID=A0ABY9UW78_9ACTN|nr:class F sortase [Streptomyces sp. SCA4-21]WNE96816.1 class F sortase [Streptomyces sp. SCA4-21]